MEDCRGPLGKPHLARRGRAREDSLHQQGLERTQGMTCMKEKISVINLVLRALMELGIVLGLAFWGYQSGSTVVTRMLLCILAPVAVFSFWGLLDFHQAGRFAEPLRLAQELIISILVAAGLYSVGQPVPAWSLAVLSIIHHTLVYALGEKLLKHQTHA